MNVPFERDRERHFDLGQATLDEAESDIEEDSIVNGVGHKKDVCPYLIRAPPSPPTQKNTPSQVDSVAVPSVDQQGDQKEYEPYGSGWLPCGVTTSSEGVEASTKEWVAVAWQKPPPGWVKLNTDGSSIGNPWWRGSSERC
nr:hypothetical protein CFP56_15280 [Quercus suber]